MDNTNFTGDDEEHLLQDIVLLWVMIRWIFPGCYMAGNIQAKTTYKTLILSYYCLTVLADL